ncbi:MAG: hypothetical protein R3F14_00035 [Polyangiaceae bacterium]
MSNWEAIADEDFDDLFRKQYAELTPEARERLEKFRVPFWKATIRRSEATGDELVFVVCQSGSGVLYFDDVEYGFNISSTDSTGRILSPGGSQATLAEAIAMWIPAPAAPDTDGNGAPSS